MYYIQETDKQCKILKILNTIKLKQDKIILPIIDEEISEKKAKKLAQKTKMILNKCNCNKIVISKKIKKQQQYINYLYSYNLEIVDGKWLFEALSQKVLEYIVNKRGLKKEELHISILVNNPSEITIENIKNIVQEYKRVNIITNHLSKFKNIEKQILEEYGIMITVTNNKRKSLENSEIILNIDFPEELINRYNIYEEAIIVNIQANIKIKRKRFNGININDYEITKVSRDEFDFEKENKFYEKDIYEGNIYKNQPPKDILKTIEKDKVKISKLITKNSIL